MTRRDHPPVDIERVRAAHRIEDVVAASGVELVPRGGGYMARCPFHNDSTASMSVGGIPGRFHCFGCGIGGDVIDYVRHLHHLPFLEAVDVLRQGSPAAPPVPARAATPAPVPVPVQQFTTGAERVMDVNRRAWARFTTSAATGHAERYLRDERGIDVTALQAAHGAPVVGYASASWSSLTAALRDQGVTDQELLDADLARPSRAGRLIDTFRDRLVLPVRDQGGGIRGFIGRDLSEDDRAPKYRNPTRTPAFDKATALYRPTLQVPSSEATVVIVEGALDALAIAAQAAETGRADRFVPCTTSGVTVSPAQARQVLALHPRPPVIALDGDDAGAEGTARWIAALCLARHRPALVTRLPEGLDPADWLRAHGPAGLAAFDRGTCLTAGPDEVAPRLPGREIVAARLARQDEPVHATIIALVPLALKLPTPAIRQLIATAATEMSRRGAIPDDAFAGALVSAIGQTRRRRHLAKDTAVVHPVPDGHAVIHSLDLAG